MDGTAGWGNALRRSLFYHSDAAGVSQRITRDYPENLLGTTNLYLNFIDPRHAEFDAAGGNVGTSTPYYEFIQPWQPQEFPDLIPIYGDSPIYVNGQRLTSTLDGLAVGCSFAFGLLGGAASPYTA